MKASRMKIRIVLAPGATTDATPIQISDRLQRHLRSIRLGRAVCDLEDMLNQLSPGADALDAHDIDKIDRRARRYHALSQLRSGMSHLKKEEAARLEPYLAGMPVAMVRSEARADEIAAGIHAGFPWLAPATEEIWHALRRAARDGTPATIPPLLLNGPPGIGKSTWARAVGRAIGAPTDAIEATSDPSGISLSGMQRGWSSHCCGRPLEMILRTGIANPLIVVDEIDKVATMTTTRGTRHCLTDVMLSLIEPQSAQAWTCPNLGLNFDMSHISWIATSNGTRSIPAPLLSRLRLVTCPPMTRSQVVAFAEAEMQRRGLSPVAADVASEIIRERMSEPSLRDVIRVIDRAESLAARPVLH